MSETAISMGIVSAVYQYECAHRRQLLAARALNERSLLLRELPFPRTRTIGEVYIDDLVILSILHLSDGHVGSSPIEVQRADAVCDVKMPTHAGKSGSTLSGKFWEDASMAFQAHSDSLLSRVSLILHDANRCGGLKSDALATPLGKGREEGRGPFALAFRREGFASLDVSYLAATVAPLLQTNVRANPCAELFATDASPSGAGGDAWLVLYDLAGENGERVRLD